MTTAVAPDFRHAVLGVSGMNYGNVLVTRSVDFSAYGKVLYASYPDPSMHPVILDLMQQLWDRGDPDGYAEQMTSHPLPDTPIAPGADADRLRRSSGQHVCRGGAGADDRSLRSRARA